MGPRAGLNRCGKSRPTGIRSPDRPARSQSLYQLSYPVHNILMEYVINDVLLSKCNVACSIAHSISCTRLFRGKMHSDWFSGIQILSAALHTVSFVHGCFAGKCILTGSTEYRYFKVDGSMEKKWDTVIPADLKRLFVSGTYMSRWSRKG